MKQDNEYTDTSGIIEFIGPPGVGKSTVFKSLCKKWNASSNWIYQDMLLQNVKPPVSETRSWVEYQLRRFVRKNGNKNIPIDFGLRFVNQHKEVAAFLWDAMESFYSNNDIGKKYRSAYFLFRDFCRYQAISESDCRLPCIVDEGLFVKSFFISGDKNEMTDLVKKYMPLRQMPYAVVFINTDQPGVIVDRLLSRKKVIASHQGKNKEALMEDIQRWQFFLHAVVREVEDYNVPVYRIDASKPVKENVLLLDNILNTIPENNSKTLRKQLSL